MTIHPSVRPGRLRCQQGIALPVTLFGLLIVAVLVGTVVVTAATEVATSGVQQDATRSLYLAQSGVERYIATTASRNEPLLTGNFTEATPDGAVRLDVRHLSTRVVGDVIDSTYVVTGEPVRLTGGRSVGAMFTRTFTPSQPLILNADIPSGLVLGANTQIRGNADVSRGPSGMLPACDKPDAGTRVTMAADAEVTLHGDAKVNIGNDTTRAWWTRDEMIQQVLGVESLNKVIPRADITFGVDDSQATHQEPSFVKNRRTKSPHDFVGYDWGCPQGLVNCGPSAKQDWLPIIVIDARGGTVEINHEYGQGMLIVLNGDVHLTADYSFKGIIAVEGLVHLNGDIHIEGSVLAQGVVTEEAGQVGTIAGSQNIYYSRCVVDDVLNRFNNPPPGSPVPQPQPPQLSLSQTYNWWEVVR